VRYNFLCLFAFSFVFLSHFFHHFSYNFEHEMSVTDLCNTKQKNGEAFTSFLQRWRGLASKLPWPIPEKQLVTMFVTNLNQELGFHLQILCASTFEEVINKGTTIEWALIAKGSIKLYDYKSLTIKSTSTTVCHHHILSQSYNIN